MKIPTNNRVSTGLGDVELRWRPEFGAESSRAFKEVQKFIDNEVLRLSTPYVPFRTGALNRSGIFGTSPGSGEVIYNAPHARYQYYGKVMVGRAPKKLTGKSLTYSGVGRGAKWFESMKTRHRLSILNGAALLSRRLI